MYLESSKDILYLVLAFSVLWFTAFVCWGLYYLISIMRDASRMIGEIRDRLHAIDDAVRGVREKFEGAIGSLGMAATGIKMVMSYLSKRKEKVAEKVRQTAAEVGKKVKKMKKRLEEEPDME